MLFHKHLLGVAILVCLSLFVMFLPQRTPITQDPDTIPLCAEDCAIAVDDASRPESTNSHKKQPTTNARVTTNHQPACFTCSCLDHQNKPVILGPICNHETNLAQKVADFDSRLDHIEVACQKLSAQANLQFESAHVWQE